MPANAPLPPIPQAWDSDGLSTRFLFWIATRAARIQAYCLRVCAVRHRDHVLRILESSDSAGPTGSISGQLDKLDVGLDRLNVQEAA